MGHEIVSVYFPNAATVSEIRRKLINSNSVSNFIVTAVEAKLALKGPKNVVHERPMQVQKNDNE